MRPICILFFILCFCFILTAQEANNKKPSGEAGKSELNNTKIDGYRGIWFSLGASPEYGFKYSGGLGTYTIKHNPMAIYAEKVDKTFFVYGGTPSESERQLLCMIGCFDHKTGKISRPTVVYDKGKVNDPHDDPTILLDSEGYIWVYVAGRGNIRPGYRYRSTKPYDISGFEFMNSSIMAYPQPMYIEGKGHFLFFTRYDGVRQLFFQTSPDGENWSNYQQIASIIGEGEQKSGHYSTSGHYKNKIAIAFNRHPDGKVDYRTNLYYLQTLDFGKTWTTADGEIINLPVTKPDSPSLIVEVESAGKNLYVKDINFDEDGNPVILYLTSSGWEAGPANGPRQWYVCNWDGKNWLQHPVTTSTHNYDSGSIWIEGSVWRIIAPTDEGPQEWGTGGEVVSWESTDKGVTWAKIRTYTKDSPRNQGYVRRPVNAKDPFYCMWADGHSDVFSISRLYFGDSKGNIFLMPYEMDEDWEKPVKIGEMDKIECSVKDITTIQNEMVLIQDPALKPFKIGKYEITQSQWYAVMGNNPSYFQGDGLPVMNVSWDEIQEFIYKLNKLTGKEYRLPTNEEWEAAAEGGNSIETESSNEVRNINHIAWYIKTSGGEPHAVGLKQPNEFGIYDMSGNVWEWVSTPVCKGAKAHFIRGGSWNYDSGCCDINYKNRHADNFRNYDIGFRLAISAGN